jgi:outer membrane protein
MSRKSLLFFSLAACCVPLSLMAQTPAAPAAQAAVPQASAVIGPAKVAWLNLEQAILSCEEGKAQFSEVQKFVDQKNSELEKKKKDVDATQTQLNVQGPKLTDEARADLEEQLQSKNTDMQRFQEDTQKEIDSKRVRVTNYIGRRMLPVIEKLAKEKGLSAVVYVNPQRDAWIDPSLIITDEVVKAYNRAYPMGAAKPAPAKP